MIDRSLDLLIDEVALGLADAADVARLNQLAASDPAIAARLEQTRLRLIALDDTADPMPLPADFWSRIEARLDAERRVVEDLAARVFLTLANALTPPLRP